MSNEIVNFFTPLIKLRKVNEKLTLLSMKIAVFWVVAMSP
jgi:hypothetical protein